MFNMVSRVNKVNLVTKANKVTEIILFNMADIVNMSYIKHGQQT